MRDWRNADDYAFTEDLKPWQWAWQFLRRNPAYRADFQAALENFNKREDDYSRRVSKRLAPGEEPESIPNAPCRQKWFIWYYLNPAIEFPDVDPFVKVVDLYMSNTHLWPLQPHEMVLRFDLRLPITRLLKLARGYLERRQRKLVEDGEVRIRSPRNQGWKWQLYLRLLDGSEAGARHDELVEVLPDPPRAEVLNSWDRVNDQMTQAGRMIQEGYRDILLLQ